MEITVADMAEFRFDSAASTPFVSAPSSPRYTHAADALGYGYPCYRSAPASPTSSARYGYSSTVPFAWEDTPGTPRPAEPIDDVVAEPGFAFQLGGPDSITAADQLFDKGRIRPLKPPPAGVHAPRSPGRTSLWQGKGRDDLDPFTAAMVISSRSGKGSRSLSSVRREVATAAEGARPVGRKWRLRDLFLFRSASEGRAVVGNGSKHPVLPKHTTKAEDSGFRSADGVGPGRGVGSVNETQHRSKRTALSFHTHGLFGCLRFNPAIGSIRRRNGVVEVVGTYNH